MPDKSKATDKRAYQRDEPVSLRPLDLRTALAGLLKVKPPASTPDSAPRPEPVAPAKRDKS